RVISRKCPGNERRVVHEKPSEVHVLPPAGSESDGGAVNGHAVGQLVRSSVRRVNPLAIAVEAVFVRAESADPPADVDASIIRADVHARFPFDVGDYGMNRFAQLGIPVVHATRLFVSENTVQMPSISYGIRSSPSRRRLTSRHSVVKRRAAMRRVGSIV